MNMGKAYKLVIVLFSFFLISACASLGIPERRQTGVTILDLERNWNEYNVYYSATPAGFPTAIMFDPKNGQDKLAGDTWSRVEHQGMLSSLISRIQAFSDDTSRTWSIIGPGDRPFGFIFSPSPQILMKVLDNHTIYVYRVLSRQELKPR
jgi:hypothetical protein